MSTGLGSVIGGAFAPGDDGIVYVGLKEGVITRLDLASGTSSTFLDISSTTSSGGQEMGLLGFAVHPDFASNGRLFVLLTSGSNIEVRSYAVDPTDPSVLDPNSEIAILSVPNPQTNNNGGTLAFGPDGYLYISLGDGGGAGDPGGNGQDPSTLLGSILRIDVDTTSGANAYGIPSDNPFANGGGAPEVFHYGLHNPVRFSIDAATGDMYIGDRGQDWQEEVDFVAGGGAGQNFGWNAFEGEFAVGPNADPQAYSQPLFVYEHDAGSAVVGGVVNDSSAGLTGDYIFGDFASGRVWALHNDGDSASVVFSSEFAELQHVTQFFKDGAGNIYATTLDGSIVRLQVSGASANHAPVAQDDAFTTDEDTPISGNVLADNGSGSDSDPEFGDALTVSAVNGLAANLGGQITIASGALLTLNGDGSFAYTPNQGFSGSDSFTYTVSDGALTDTATVEINVEENPISPVVLSTGLGSVIGGAFAPGDDGIVYVGLKEGVITRLDLASGTSSTFLDISSTTSSGGQMGLVQVRRWCGSAQIRQRRPPFRPSHFRVQH